MTTITEELFPTPYLRSMKITHEVRDYAAAEMERKAAEFRARGGEIYLKT